MAGVGRQRHASAFVEHQRCVAAHAPVRAEDDRHSKDRGLEHRVQPGAMKATADERRFAQRVEIRENPDAIHHDDGTRLRMLEL